MDQPGLDEQTHRHALRSLQRINFFSRSSHILWPSISQLAQEFSDRPIKLLDVACGGGDVAVTLYTMAAKRGITLQVEGCDLSPVAVKHCREHADKRRASVKFHQFDAIQDGIPGSYDVVTCSLFLHHLEEETAVRLLRHMASSSKHLVLINDLIRSRFGYLLAYFGCRLLSRSGIVHVDGPLSVAAAFTCDEALELSQRAGLAGARISKHWPERFLMSWRKT